MSASQAVMMATGHGDPSTPHPAHRMGPVDSLFLLPMLVGASAICLALYIVIPHIKRFYRKHFSRNKDYAPLFEDAQVDEPDPSFPGLRNDLMAHIRAIGPWIFGFEVVRALLLAGLLALSIYATVIAEGPEDTSGTVGTLKHGMGKEKHRKHKHRHNGGDDPLGVNEWSLLEWEEFGVSGFYLYNLIISIFLLTLRPTRRVRSFLSVNIHTLLLGAFILYAYRDLYPLGTFHSYPVDVLSAPAWLTWVRIGLLGAAAILIPICKPRLYKPVDPANPQSEPHPEQTVPYISFFTFQFLDSLIFKAWNTPSLPYEALPVLTDYDRSAYLAKSHLYKLDPVLRKQRGLKQRHLVFGIIATFWKSALIMMSMVVVKSASEFAGPIGVNRILTYLQEGRSKENDDIKPWVWIALLFLGPTVGTLAFQCYIFTSTRAITRAEAIFTQLIFDHALRIKMRDEVEAEKPSAMSGAATPAIVVEDTTDLVNGQTAIEQTNSDNGTTLNGQANGDGASVSTKGKSKRSGEAEAAPADKKSKDIIGKINNLMGSDIDAIVEGRDLFLVILYSPLQILFAVIFLWRILGWSSIVGMGCIVITLPIPGYLAKFMHSVQIAVMQASDARLAKVTEAINALKMLKLFAWEEKMNEQLALKREIELGLSRKKQFINQVLDSVNFVLPAITMIASYGLYTTVQGQTLTAATVFSSLAVFELIREQMFMVTWLVNTTITAAVSVGRLNEYLQTTELLDRFEADREEDDIPGPPEMAGEIAVKDASFTWNKPNPNGPSGRNFRLKIDHLQFKKGELNIVAGATGSGKTSLLMALLGEMVFFANSSDAYFTLPRAGGLSYVAQESWVFAATVKENILFGTPYDEQRYKKVIHQCALEKDLELMPAGDETELGEKGLNASGGQKARISLARAVYALTDIVLLDDVLSALDVHTSRWIVDKCFKGDLLAGRTVVLVTHHVAMVAPIASYIVHLGMDGMIESQGPVDQALKNDQDLREAMEQDANEVENKEHAASVENAADSKEVAVDAKADEAKKAAGKLTGEEEKSEGRISRKALFVFFKALGGPFFWFIFITFVIAGEAIQVGTNYWLGVWARAYAQANDPKDVSVVFYLGTYIAIVLSQIAVWNIMNANFIFGSIRASRNLHARLVESIFAATLRFLDSTPSGRIIARFTKDIKAIDGGVARLMLTVFEISVTLCLRFGLILLFVPIFTPVALLVAIAGGLLGELYIHGQLAIKREMSNAKSPLFTAMAAQVQGITSIRAYGAQNKVKLEAQTRIDKYTRAANSFYLLNRWVTIRMDMLGAAFSAGLAGFLVYRPNVLDASIVGYTLTLGISAAQFILWLVRIANEFEVQGNSVERVAQYLIIPHEAAFDEKAQPPAYWPASGSIVINDLSAKYSEDGPLVLKNISLSIISGERVGIVGRTGSGKSTTALALLRMIPTTGSVIIDGVDTKTINLNALRSHVSCIPQDPVLLEGTLRYNLDPFGEMDDAELYDAMQASGLGLARQSADGASTPTVITLETNIAAGGSNLSQGQRQLVSLARALLRKAKVLVLDEATASVDHATDNLVQKAIRNVRDTTILTIAHRLSTIMDYDKIIVLDAGQLMEFDSPRNLLNKPDGKLRALVNDSGDIEALEKLAQGGSKSS